MREAVHSTSGNLLSEEGDHRFPGELVRQTCRLRAVIVSYPVELSQRGQESDWDASIGTNEMDTSDFYHFNKTGKQQNQFPVNQTIFLPDFPYDLSSSTQSNFGNNTYGGLALGLQAYFGGYAYASRADNTTSYKFRQFGNAQSQIVNLPPSGSYAFNFSDPFEGGTSLLDDDDIGPESKFIDPGLIGKINSIMFGLVTWTVTTIIPS